MLAALVLPGASPCAAQTVDAQRPLLSVSRADLGTKLPRDTRLLDEAGPIEAFLDAVDGEPPDWASLWGAQGRGHDERLFALNRERDARRAGGKGERAAAARRVTFLWPGELSSYDPFSAGFRLAIGPKTVPTRWGLVRFKPEGLPSNLIAVPSPALRRSLRDRVARGEKVEVEVAITGRLLPEESIIYDFAHEEAGRGMVMPVVLVEQMDYLLVR